MEAHPERCRLSHQGRVGARGVGRLFLPERSGGYRFLQALARPDSSSCRFNQLASAAWVSTSGGANTARDQGTTFFCA